VEFGQVLAGYVGGGGVLSIGTDDNSCRHGQVSDDAAPQCVERPVNPANLPQRRLVKSTNLKVNSLVSPEVCLTNAAE
jgi:hypothetical protein